MGWKEWGSLGGAPGQSWKDSQPLCSAPHLSRDSFAPSPLCFGLLGVLPRKASPPPGLLAHKILLEHLNRSKTCTIPFTPSFIPFAFIFSHILPHTCAQLKPHDFPASPWGSPSQFRRRSRSSRYPRPQGLPQAQPPRKPQPRVWHLHPKDTSREGRAPVLSCPDTPDIQEVVPSTSPGNTSLHQGCPGGEAPQPPLKGNAEVTPLFLEKDSRRDLQGHREVAPTPLTCRRQSWRQGKQIQLVPGTGFPSPSTLQPQTLWDGKDIFPISLAKQSPQCCETPGRIPGITSPDSLPPSLGKQLLGPFQDGWRRPRSSAHRAGSSSSCRAGNAQFHAGVTPAALPERARPRAATAALQD